MSRSNACGHDVEHVYVHVPFCPTICPFCDFHVLERRAGAVAAYLDRLERDAAEAARFLGHRGVSTVYLGGGTPSYLREAELERLVGILVRHLGWATEEATLEVHPLTVTPSRARAWVALGFTRLSLGVQSTQDEVLRFLGRPHDAAGGLAALDAVLAAGAATTSVDVITAVPGQDVHLDLERLVSSGVDHLSAYTLTIEPGTPFARDGVEVDAAAEAAALQAAADVLGRHGFERYEVSNHARPGQRCAHNLAYWHNRCYLGLGPGASCFEPAPEGALADVVGCRRTSPPLERWLAGERGSDEPVTRHDLLREAVLTRLRLREGVDLADVSARAGLDARAELAGPLDAVVAAGLAELVEGRWLRPTPAGFALLDQVTATFL
ncbi:MAG: radical SAM protein [Acidimicrobiia bacterium]|nr:radical SAM protein [Acidimicrobiia bacterium]